MNPLPKPSLDPAKVYDSCVALYSDDASKVRLTGSKDTVMEEIAVYDERGLAAELFLMEEFWGVEEGATGDELIGLYDRMLDKKRSGRTFYDKLRSAAKDDTCPYCGQRKVSSLDHYLPKKRFPLLAVAPVNLIPSCSDCNKDKDTKANGKRDKQFIHPYFDRLPAGVWLHAEIRQTSPATFRFRAEAPSNWPSPLPKRIKFHFNELNLGRLYTSHAGSHLSKIRGSLRRCHARSVHHVKAWIRDAADSAAEINPNSWEAAFHEACFASDWFCEGGFLPE